MTVVLCKFSFDAHNVIIALYLHVLLLNLLLLPLLILRLPHESVYGAGDCKSDVPVHQS